MMARGIKSPSRLREGPGEGLSNWTALSVDTPSPNPSRKREGNYQAGMPLIDFTSMKSLRPNTPPSRPLPDAL